MMKCDTFSFAKDDNTDHIYPEEMTLHFRDKDVTYATFEYDENFVESGIEISPLNMQDEPYEEGIFQTSSAEWLHARVERQKFIKIEDLNAKDTI